LLFAEALKQLLPFSALKKAKKNYHDYFNDSKNDVHNDGKA